MKTTLDRSELNKLIKLSIGGVYLLYQDRQLIYVGRSINIYKRVYLHMTQGKQFDSYMVIPADYRLACAIESVLIALLEPRDNLVINTFDRTINNNVLDW